jgi:hypothetical protein
MPEHILSLRRILYTYRNPCARRKAHQRGLLWSDAFWLVGMVEAEVIRQDSRQTNILLSVGDSFEVKSLYVHGQATCSPITILYNFREDIHTSSVAMAIARNSIPRAVDMDTKRQIFLQATPSLSIPFSTVVSPGLSKPTTDVSSHHSTTNRSDAYLEFPCIVLRRTTSRMKISAISSV